MTVLGNGEIGLIVDIKKLFETVKDRRDRVGCDNDTERAAAFDKNIA